MGLSRGHYLDFPYRTPFRLTMILLLSFALAGVLCSPRLWRLIFLQWRYWRNRRRQKQLHRDRLRFLIWMSQERLNQTPRK